MHEVNNPLGVIHNYLEALAGRLGDTEAVEEIRAMGRELGRIRKILARLANGDTPTAAPEFEVTDLNSLIREVVGLVAPGARNVRFRARLDQTLEPLPLPVDPCKQVVLILLRNAIEAVTDSADPHIRVTTRAAVNVDGDGYVAIAVTDNGAGISATQRLELSGTNQTSTRGQDRGLGLTIARQLMDDLGGHISCTPMNGTEGVELQVLIPTPSPDRAPSY